MSVIGPVVGNFLNFLIQNLRVKLRIDNLVESYGQVKGIINAEIQQAKENMEKAENL